MAKAGEMRDENSLENGELGDNVGTDEEEGGGENMDSYDGNESESENDSEYDGDSDYSDSRSDSDTIENEDGDDRSWVLMVMM